MKINKWIKSSKCVITPGGDPLWECENCGCGEHVYGIENVNEPKRYCPDCGNYNLYPWEEKIYRRNNMETYIDRVVDMVEKETGLKSKQTIKYYALLVLVKGEDVTLSDVHDGWSMVMNYKESNPPYCYGHDHKSIVPFDELSKETQDRDIKYVEALRKIAREIK